MPSIFSPQFYVPCLLVIGTYILLWIVKNVGIVRLRKISALTENIIDDIVLNVLEVTRQYFIIGVSLYVGFQALHYDKSHGHYADYAFVILFSIQVIIWGKEAIRSWIQITIQRKNNDPSVATSLGFVSIILKFALIAVVLLFALNNLGVNVSTFLAGLGVGGIALALATQNILGDLFSSLSIVMDKPFVVGDYISLGEWQGTIENIGLKTTRIRSLNGEQIIVSNSDLLSSKIRNFKRMETRRVAFVLKVTYRTSRESLKKAPELIEGIVKKYDKIKFDRAHFLRYGDYALEIEVVYVYQNANFNDYANDQQKILLEIGEAFEKNGIEFALPSQALVLQKES